MTPTARTVLPTDLPALVTYDGRVYANEAMTLDRLGTDDSPHPLEAALEQWFSFATGRHTWISVKGARLRGLASARKRGSKLAWEIECLIDAEDDDGGVLLSLLDQVTEAAGKSGALKIFLRLPSDSDAIEGARRSGFTPYRRERVYRIATADAPGDATPALRRRSKADAYPLFQLYNHVVPEDARRLEGATLADWTASQETLGKTAQYVIDREDRVGGWLRLAGDGDVGRFEVLGVPEIADDLIDGALAKLSNREWAYTLTPEHQPGFESRLQERGFEPGEAYTVLARRTVRTVKAAKTAPAVVQTTFG